jgi:hypothetical protein
MLGDGAGALAAPVDYPAGSQPGEVAIGDFNGDDEADLVAPNGNGTTVSVLLGDGDGTFAAAVDHAVGNNPAGIAVADLNGDGLDDLAVANAANANVSLLFGDGAGGFAAQPTHPVGVGPHSVAVGDFNGDGRPDLATADSIPDNVSVLLGTGAGAFAPAVFHHVGDGAEAVVARDLDGDGRTDIASANRNVDALSVLHNTSRPAIVFDPNAGITFANQPVGTRSASRIVTISNLGAAPLLISSVRPSGPDADEYSVSGDNCSGAPVVPGAICQVSVRFAPVTQGTALASLLAVSNAAISPGGVPLLGVGTPAPAGGSTGPAGANGTNGLNGAAGPGGPKGDQGAQGPAGKNGRDAVVTCKAKRGKVKVTCTVRFRAASSSTRVRARITRGHRVYASGARAVKAGAKGSVSLRAHRRLARGRYTLLLTFADARGRESVIRQRVRVR